MPARCVVSRVRCPGPLGSVSPVCLVGVLYRVFGVLSHLPPVHRCAGSVRCLACAVSWATWLLFTGVLARCFMLSVRLPGPLGSCSPACLLGVLCCVCSVMGYLAPAHRCARSSCCIACAVSWATSILVTGVLARCVVSRVRCPGPLGSCSPVCLVGVSYRVFGVLSHLPLVHRCAGSVRCLACAVSWATSLLFTGVLARCFMLCVWLAGPLGSCSPACLLRVLCCVCSVMGYLAHAHRCSRSSCCIACAVSRAPSILFAGVLARCFVLFVRFPGSLGSGLPERPLGCLCRVCGVLRNLAPVYRCLGSMLCVVCACPWTLGSCSPLCPLNGLYRLCGVLGLVSHLGPVQRCVGSVLCVAYGVLWATWLLFTGVLARCTVLRAQCAGPHSSCSPTCSLAALCGVCSVLGHLAPVHRCARSVLCAACAVSLATLLLFTCVLTRCFMLCVRCPGPLSSCSPVCPLGALCCVCGVLSHLIPVHRCARSVLCGACAVSWATWLLFTGVLAWCVVLVCGVLGNFAPVHLCARLVLYAVCAVSWATWLLFTGVPARCVVLRLRCPGPLNSCSPVCSLGVLCRVYGVLGHLAPVHRYAWSVCRIACSVSLATCLLFTDVPVPCAVWRVRCPGPPGSCSQVCLLGALCCLCGCLNHWAPVHRRACSVCCVACAVSWATWLLPTGVPARPVASRVRCPGPLRSSSLVCWLGVLCRVYGVLGHLAPVHRYAWSVCRIACSVSLATWLLFTGVPVPCAVLRVRCPGPPRSCSPVCLLGALCCVCGCLGHLAPVHRRACSVCCVACAVSWATWLMSTGVPARRVASRVRCPGPLRSCSLVCWLGALCCLCGFLGHLAPVYLCARSVVYVVCAVSCATLLLFTGVLARCFVLCVRVLGHLAPVHLCARSMGCIACAVSWASWATWVLFNGVLARCFVSHMGCCGPLGSCSPVCSLGALCCARSVLGHIAPIHRRARSLLCVVFAVSWATWLLFTGVLARCFVLREQSPGPPCSCSPVCSLGALCCVCGVLGHLARVHRCAHLVRCVVCAVS